MKKIDWVALICGLLLSAVSRGSAQPAFQNLNFESAGILVGELGYAAPFSNAFPAWTGYIDIGQVPFAYVDSFSLGRFGISI